MAYNQSSRGLKNTHVQPDAKINYFDENFSDDDLFYFPTINCPFGMTYSLPSDDKSSTLIEPEFKEDSSDEEIDHVSMSAECDSDIDLASNESVAGSSTCCACTKNLQFMERPISVLKVKNDCIWHTKAQGARVSGIENFILFVMHFFIHLLCDYQWYV